MQHGNNKDDDTLLGLFDTQSGQHDSLEKAGGYGGGHEGEKEEEREGGRVALSDEAERWPCLERVIREPIPSYALLRALMPPPTTSSPAPHSSTARTLAAVLSFSQDSAGRCDARRRRVVPLRSQNHSAGACEEKRTAPTPRRPSRVRTQGKKKVTLQTTPAHDRVSRSANSRNDVDAENEEEGGEGEGDEEEEEKGSNRAAAMHTWLKQHELIFHHRRYMRMVEFRNYLDWRLRCRRLVVHEALERLTESAAKSAALPNSSTCARASAAKGAIEQDEAAAAAIVTIAPTPRPLLQQQQPQQYSARYSVRPSRAEEDTSECPHDGRGAQLVCTAKAVNVPNQSSVSLCTACPTTPCPPRAWPRERMCTPSLHTESESGAVERHDSATLSACWDALYDVFCEHADRSEARAGRRSREMIFQGVWVAKALEEMVRHERARVCDAVARFEPTFSAAVLSVQAMHQLRNAIIDKIRHKPLIDVTDVYVTPREMMRFLIRLKGLRSTLLTRHIVQPADVVEAMPSAVESALVAHVFDVLQSCKLG